MLFYLVLILAFLIVAYTLLQWFAQADPKAVIHAMKWGGGVLLILFVVWLALSGKLALAFAGLPALFIWFQRFRMIMQLGRALKGIFGAGKIQTPDPKKGPMTRKQALEVLELDEDSSPEEIKAAYHRKIKEAHPDLGGSDEHAAQINQAKDVLLND
ncbi:J domain-containing protein [Terasakiella sp. A23]|uniref:J domain-containing protein n=1 Tax=Terasakiella sp. FCG-A23 TaxID=3080561 RepID=UPI002954E0F6|nr:J domain-containing protein [Terasakiella sp. A23]MDV7338559.1 J domain-containing protein [Terasakiella sp. A23]